MGLILGTSTLEMSASVALGWPASLKIQVFFSSNPTKVTDFREVKSLTKSTLEGTLSLDSQSETSRLVKEPQA